MEIESIKVSRRGKEDDSDAVLIVEVCINGTWFELGGERINSNFSTCWNVKHYSVQNCPKCNSDGKVLSGSACGDCSDGKVFV